MSRNVEELLRQGLDRATADAELPEPPASLLRRARHHNRHRREAIAGALAAGGAAIAAVATFLATATPVVSVSGQTINYVTTRAEQALAHTSQGRAVQYDTRTISNGSFGVTVVNLAFNGTTGSTAQVPTVLSDLQASRLVAWTYRDQQLQQGYSASGQLLFSATIGPVTNRQGKQVYEAYGAVYPDRVQWHTPLTGGPDIGDRLTCANSGFDLPNWPQGITKALSCHVFTLAGNQEINGIDTIKLVRKAQYGIGETLWVDPTSYLPVRITTTFRAHQHASVQTDNFRWLQPTTGNLAALHAAEARGAIPSGFKSLPSTYVPLPGANTPAP
jgi:hypothetical protein